MPITIFEVIVRNETLQNIEKLLKREKKPHVQTVSGPQGEDIELRTTIERIKKQSGEYGDGISASLKYDFTDEYVDRGGKHQSVTKSNTVEFVFISGSIHLLVFTGRNEANKITEKISRIIYNQKEEPILSCQIHARNMERFISEHNPRILACSWKELNIPTLGNASISGTGIEGSHDFRRFNDHGVKHSIRLQIPSKGVTLSMNRNASVHFFTKQDVSEQMAFIKEHVLQMCS